MPPYGGFFMAVDPLQKHIFRGALMLGLSSICKHQEALANLR
jgi:hypothetical protein